VLRRRAPKRPHLNNTDRFLFVWLYHWFPSVLGVIAIVRPETIIRWHRTGFRAYWRWRSRNHVGRPKVSPELRTLIGEMSRANPLWGAPHIHGELLKLGFEVAQSTVARYICRHSRPPSQGWRTFLSNHADGIAALDLFVLPTIAFRILYCLVIIRHGRRIWLSQRLRAMGIRDRPIAFRSPWQNAYVERLIGSIRRECLDHMIVFGEAHLRRILGAYAAYYNESRTHRSLNKDAPFHRAIERLGAITSHPVLGGLHHQYCRI
jgi:hypothetical protein